ncbi:hypothetical protein WMY93_027849 [Mugilogobius chulae]|uniref:Uncharacterized protein n=1 Tax=Mugilogobius chulae TaxID=88201 RepID=A0AAW0MXJ2_9GOBI
MENSSEMAGHFVTHVRERAQLYVLVILIFAYHFLFEEELMCSCDNAVRDFIVAVKQDEAIPAHRESLSAEEETSSQSESSELLHHNALHRSTTNVTEHAHNPSHLSEAD